MVSTNSMVNRSSLELMLDKLRQQPEDQPGDVPPPLPARPVSRARLPPARRPLQLDCQRRSLEEFDAGSGRAREAMANGSASFDHFQKEMQLLGRNPKNTAENGVLNIQRWYRGHRVRCWYRELATAAITIQSFVRGKNTQRYRDHRIIKLEAILLIQRQTRKFFEQREFGENRPKIESTGRGRVEGEEDLARVSYGVVTDLRKRVLRSEASVRQREEENAALRMQIQEMERKWQQYEERMGFLEKAWQDELINLQERLAAVNKNEASEIQSRDLIITSYDRDRELTHENDDTIPVNEVGLVQGCSILHPRDELRKLKRKFKSWKKDYKNKLRDTQTALRKLDNSKTATRGERGWWGKRSH